MPKANNTRSVKTGDRLSPKKMRVSVALPRKMMDKVRHIADRTGASTASVVSRLIADGLEEQEQFSKYFSDPDVRALFVDLLKKPGAMKKLAQAAGEIEPPLFVQQEIYDILQPNESKKS